MSYNVFGEINITDDDDDDIIIQQKRTWFTGYMSVHEYDGDMCVGERHKTDGQEIESHHQYTLKQNHVIWVHQCWVTGREEYSIWSPFYFLGENKFWKSGTGRHGPDENDGESSSTDGAMKTKRVTDGVPALYGDGC